MRPVEEVDDAAFMNLALEAARRAAALGEVPLPTEPPEQPSGSHMAIDVQLEYRKPREQCAGALEVGVGQGRWPR